MPYTPHTAEDIARMLAVIGAGDVEELFASLPEEIRLRDGLALPPSRSEQEVRRHLAGLAARNRGQEDLVSFLGGGVYDSFVPAAVEALSARSEFLTAYTPYQAEVSQGTLQAIYEWQTFVARLTGLAVANASLYDGANALTEAVRVGVARTRRARVVLPRLLNPRWRRVARTVLLGEGVEILEAPAAADGTTDVAALGRLAAEGVGAVVLQNPNHLGRVEPVRELAAAARAGGAMLVAAVNPVSLSLLAAPGEYGADLACGEAQPLGIPCSWGGPLLGFLAARDELKRLLPGRLVGRTVDAAGRTGYVLTLQTREQHIRRERATSNVCTNQGLNMLRATIYLAMLGPEGLRELGRANLTRAAALRRAALRAGAELPFDGPFFNEIVVRLPRPARLFLRHARRQGVLAGVPLAGMDGCGEGDLLVAVTEKRTAAEIERWERLLAAWLGEEREERE